MISKPEKAVSVPKKDREKSIRIRDEKHGLPYSKGLMARSITPAGVPEIDAHEVARLIEEHLIERNIDSITGEELQALAMEKLREHVGEEYADRLRRWQTLQKLDKPLIILIGGTTGVGKSTIATEVAHRLGITRTVSTDALREVMRAVIAPELMPTLHVSSFAAWQVLQPPLTLDSDRVITGFKEQTSAINVGARAVLLRAIREGLNMVIEGVHVVPGFIDLGDFFKDAFIVPIVITVDNEEDHRSHFTHREYETEGTRPFKRYLKNFNNIRKIGRYIESQAGSLGIARISSYGLDTTVEKVLDVIMTQVLPKEAQTDASNEATTVEESAEGSV